MSATCAFNLLVAPKLYQILDDFNMWFLIMITQSILFIFVVINFVMAICRDPGRYPKIIISPDDPNFNDDTKSPLYKTIVINKTNVKIKWCSVNYSFFSIVTL